MTPSLLEVRTLTKRFGGLTAVDECSMTVEEGAITGLIGPNGSGKTTVLNMVSGYLSPDSGEIRLAGRPVVAGDPTRMYRLGVSRTFQRARVFPEISVRENLLVAVPQRGCAIFRVGAARDDADRADALLEDFRLTRLAGVRAGELSYGQQKLLEFATVLMSRPRLLLLDEPTAGVNHVLIETMVERIQQLHAGGMTIVIIEHNMEFVMELCDPVIVLDHGRVLFQGPPAQVQSDRLVLEAYLGD